MLKLAFSYCGGVSPEPTLSLMQPSHPDTSITSAGGGYHLSGVMGKKAQTGGGKEEHPEGFAQLNPAPNSSQSQQPGYRCRAAAAPRHPAPPQPWPRTHQHPPHAFPLAPCVRQGLLPRCGRHRGPSRALRSAVGSGVQEEAGLDTVMLSAAEVKLAPGQGSALGKPLQATLPQRSPGCLSWRRRYSSTVARKAYWYLSVLPIRIRTTCET